MIYGNLLKEISILFWTGKTSASQVALMVKNLPANAGDVDTGFDT